MKKDKTKGGIDKKHTLSKLQKNKDEKAWYKEKADKFDTYESPTYASNEKTEYHNMQVNYDLFNNKLNLDDMKHVCTPFGIEVENSPVKMTNKDISSGKIKAMLGMESKRPFPHRIVAINPEATTRKEQEEFSQLKEYVVEQIMGPIQQQIAMEFRSQMEGQELNADQEAEVVQQMQEQIKARTPEEVKKYMLREHQDPAEAMANQLLNVIKQETDLKRKFNSCFKHACIGGKEVMYVGVINDKPDALVVNTLRFRHDRSADLVFIEDGEWATYEHRMSPSNLVNFFVGELDEDEINQIYEFSKMGGRFDEQGNVDLFEIDERYNDYEDNEFISVIHSVWKAPRKIGFLTYIGSTGEEELQIVDESYKLNPDFGDIEIEWSYLPEVHETWKIKLPTPIYKRMRPIPGQFKDINNLYHSKLPYYGILFDNMNSASVSPMDRMKFYQYLFNTIMFRKEKLMASDQGKKVLMNINVVPDAMGMKKWQQAADTTPYMWYDPNEEGTGYNDVNTVAKVVDLSLASDIRSYMEIAEFVRIQLGRSVGIPDQVEGQIAPGEAVRNTQQNLIQSSYLLEPYYELHNHFKKNVLLGLLETAKVAYSGEGTKKLTYVLDDLSVEILNIDMGLLDSTTLGMYISDSGEVQKIKETIEQLAHAAMQNQRAELSDVVAVLRQDSIIEAEETLRIAEDRRREADSQAQREAQEFQAAEDDKKRDREREKHEENKEIIVLKEEERRKTEVIKSSLLGASFNPDLDKDRDGVNDFIEIAKQGLDADIKQSQAQLEREKFEHSKQVDAKKLQQTDKKLENDKKKIDNTSKNKAGKK